MDRYSLLNKSYDFAADVTKQLISLSVALTASLAVLSRLEIFSLSEVKIQILCSVGFFLISIVFGVLSLMGAAGNYNKMAFSEDLPEKLIKHPEVRTAYDRNIRVPGALQIGSFLIGLVFLVTIIF